MNDAHLRIYLNDHLAGSVVAVEQAEHCLAHNEAGALGALLPRLLAEIRDDQGVLEGLLGRIGGTENPLKQAAAWVAEKAHRAKRSGDLLGYSDLKRLEELEMLVLGVAGKQVLWEALGATCASDDRFRDVDFPALAASARQQRADLEPHHLDAARRAFDSTATD